MAVHQPLIKIRYSQREGNNRHNTKFAVGDVSLQVNKK